MNNSLCVIAKLIYFYVSGETQTLFWASAVAAPPSPLHQISSHTVFDAGLLLSSSPSPPLVLLTSVNPVAARSVNVSQK